MKIRPNLATNMVATLSWLLAGALPAQPTDLLPAQHKAIPFFHIGRVEGLASSVVKAVVQDGRGFWWIGTDNGLQRFDGHNFRTYRHRLNEPGALPHDQIESLFFDREQHLWVLTARGLCRYDEKTDRFGPVLIAASGHPSVFFQDSRGAVWLAVAKSTVLYRLSPGQTRWEPLPLPFEVSGNGIAEDRITGDVWFATMDGLAFFSQKDHTFRHSGLHPDAHPVFSRAEIPESMLIDRDNRLFIWKSNIVPARDSFAIRWQLPSGASRAYDCPPTRGKLFQSSDGELRLILNGHGPYWCIQYDPETDRWAYQSTYPDGPYRPDFPYEGLSHVYEDREQNIWLSTSNGIFVFNPRAQHARTIRQVPDSGGGVHTIKFIQTCLETREGNIWLGTYFQGLYVLDRDFRLLRKYIQTKETRPASNKSSNHNFNSIWSLHQDRRGNIWAGGQHGTLQQFDAAGHLLRQWQPEAMNRETIRCIAEDADGHLWFGTQHGLLVRRDAVTGAFTVCANIGHPVNQILPNGHNTLWVAAHTYLYRWDILKGKWAGQWSPGGQLPDIADPTTGIGGLTVWNDSTLLTHGNGLFFFDQIHCKFRAAQGLEGLPSKQVSVLLKTSPRQIWLGTLAGLAKWDPDSAALVTYDAKDGVLNDEFREINAGIRLRDGRVLMALHQEGFLVFHPDSLADRVPPPDVQITGMRVFERQWLRPSGDTPEFRHDENYLGFEFAALSWLQTGQLSYRYRLEGYDRDWMENGTNRFAAYTGLPPGHYTFQVQARNREGVFSTGVTELHFYIRPPWWQTAWAYAGYLLLAGGLLTALYRFLLRRRLEHAEAVRLKELDAVKTRLYTNITHEFRTPLTVISGMADQVNEHPDIWLEQGTALIKRNSNRLLELVNQMLDLAKLESGKMPLHLQQGDLVNYVKYLLESFHSLAENKGVQLHFLSEIASLTMDYDAEKIQQVLANLLSNAIKFTPAGGHVYVELRLKNPEQDASPGNALVIRVRDTGIGIDENKLPYIFDRFYQVDAASTRQGEGTGIGLALTRELVKLMDGDISAASRPGQGTEMIVTLPARKRASAAPGAGYWSDDFGATEKTETRSVNPTPPDRSPVFFPFKRQQEPETGATKIPASKEQAMDHPVVLVAEDNADVVTYLAACLAPRYTLAVARNGQECIDMAAALIPDLVISDVMMPLRDGFEVCHALKNDLRTSHIPLILLTAKADLPHKLDGLRLGADVYLAKPFQREELLAHIDNLLESRQKLQAHYLGVAGLAAPPVTEQPEDRFVLKVRQAIEAHLDEYDFTVEQLCRETGMSNAHLHRKLTALTGLSAIRFMRHIRLKHAKELLRDPANSITAVAFDTGFNDPSYFSRIFKQEFGVTPKEWREGR